MASPMLRNLCAKFPKKRAYIPTRRTLCTQSLTEDEVVYPKIKPKYPPGEWSNTFDDPKEAWKWQEEVIDRIESYPTVQERLNHNLGLFYQLYYYDIRPFHNEPHLLKYHKLICKTTEEAELHDDTPAILSDDLKSLSKTAKNEAEKAISRAHMLFKDRKDKPPNKLIYEKNCQLAQELMTRLFILVSKYDSTLSDFTLHRDIVTQTHWMRGGPNFKNNLFCSVLDSSTRYGYRQQIPLQIRAPNPLRPSPHDGVGSNFNEFTVDAHKVGLMPTAYSMPHSPGFDYGAPDPYVALSVICPPATSIIGVKHNIEKDHANAGMLQSFATLYSSAHYLGYDMFHDLTTPLRTRSITSYDKFMSITNFQLNTMNILQNVNDQPKVNLYQTSELMQLYEDVDVNGKVSGISTPLLEKLLLLLRPSTQEPAICPHVAEANPTPNDTTSDLFPYLPAYEDRSMDLPELEEGSVNIPTFKRYTDGGVRLREWDLTKEVRLRRVEEKKYTEYYNKGPYFGRYDPPARGPVNLTQKIQAKREAEKERRLQLRQEIEDYQNKTSKPST